MNILQHQDPYRDVVL